MGKLYKWASSAFALIPGLAVIAKNLVTPPGISHYLLGGIIEAFGAFTLLSLTLKKTYLEQMTPNTLIRRAVVFFSLFFIFLLSYLYLYYSQVIYSDKYDESLLVPFWHGQDLDFMIKNGGGIHGIISAYGPQGVVDAINNSPPYDVITMIIFIVVYVCIFECLTLGFGFIAVQKETEAKSVRHASAVPDNAALKK